MELRICIDVDNMERAIAFYIKGLGLRCGKQFQGGFVELLGAGSPIDLLLQAAGGRTPARPRRHPQLPAPLDTGAS